QPGRDRRLAELRDVGARDERAPGAGDDDRAHRRVVERLLHALVQPLADMLAERVDRGVVHGQHRDATTAVEIDGLGDGCHGGYPASAGSAAGGGGGFTGPGRAPRARRSPPRAPRSRNAATIRRVRALAGVLFDMGGVVMESPLHAIARYEHERGLPPNSINRVVAAAGESGAWARLERGELTVASFCAPFEADCRAHGLEVDSAAVMAAIADAGVPRPAMLEAIRRLRAH